MAKIKLTKPAVDAAQPQAKAVELRDTVVPGFLCKVTPAGRKVFMLQYRTNAGERRKPALGQFGELTVEQARFMAQEWLAEVRKGGDPSAAKTAARKAPTMKEYCTTFIEGYSKQRNKPSTQRGYQGVIDRCIIPIISPYHGVLAVKGCACLHACGLVAAKGLADELHDRGYLVIDGVDGKAHYVALNARDELANYPTGAVVEVKDSAAVRAADRNITALASDGLYRADHHLAIEQGRAKPGRDPQEVVAAHVRRLEALRRAGIVERVAEGLWKVPDDLAERGRQYDAQRLGGVAVELKSHLPIEWQARAIGATWLDQQLIGGGQGLGNLGFGGDVKQAMQQRADFLEEQGLAQRRGQRVILARNLLATLRNRELAQAAKDIAADTGLEHRPIADGQHVAGIYRRSVMLASGRYAMLDDGMGFSLVPWRPVIEQRLGRQIAATVRSGGVLWDIGRQRGPAIG